MALIRPGMGIRVGSPIAGWTPLALGPSLLEWWSADSGITQSSGMVSSWQGRKAGRTLTQATSTARPLWSATAFGGTKAGLIFDGNDDCLYSLSASGWFPTGNSPVEMWAVVQQDAPVITDTALRCIASMGNSAFNTDLRLRRQEQSGANRYQGTVGAGGSAGTGSVSGVDFSSRHVVRLRAESTRFQMSLDGSALDTINNTKSVDATQFAIGSLPNGSAQYHRGRIRDVIVTPLLSVEQAAPLLTYLLKERAI